MADNESKKKYDIQYAKNKLKRIPLDVQKEKYDEIKAAAVIAGESVNRYIFLNSKFQNSEYKKEPKPLFYKGKGSFYYYFITILIIFFGT